MTNSGADTNSKKPLQASPIILLLLQCYQWKTREEVQALSVLEEAWWLQQVDRQMDRERSGIEIGRQTSAHTHRLIYLFSYHIPRSKLVTFTLEYKSIIN